VAYLIFDEQFTAFTPSRFMTFLAYPLAIYAGYALARLIAIGARRFSLRADMLVGAVVVVVGLASVAEVVRLAGLRSVSEEGVALARRIEAKVLADGFVLYEDHVVNKMQPYPWISYLTWRRSVYTPIPASENRQLLRQIREEMWQLKISRIPQWVASGEVPIYYASVNAQTKEVEIKRLTEGEQ
jgi:asparagine N-glycosylation enzyme membrane subunit Stt3